MWPRLAHLARHSLRARCAGLALFLSFSPGPGLLFPTASAWAQSAAPSASGLPDRAPAAALAEPERNSLGESDTAFLRMAQPLAEAGIATARIAIIRAGHSAVRKLGRDQLADQTTDNEELKRLAAQHGITLQAQPGLPRTLQALERLSGDDFDHAYLQLQKADSELALRLFEQQVRRGNGPIKAWAEARLPRVQAHHKLVAAM